MSTAVYGAWPPSGGPPQIPGPPPKPSAPITQVYEHWRNRDGSPLGALNAAIKIIEIYAERRPPVEA